MQIDPLADISNGYSTYNYCANNPILRNDPTGLKDTTIRGEKIQIDKDLPNVTVTAKRKGEEGNNWLNWPKVNKGQGYWSNVMHARIRDNKSLSQNGDPSWLKGQLAFHQRSYQAELDYRNMSLQAVGILAAPIVAVGAVEAGVGTAAVQGLRWTFKLKLGANIGAATADLTTQALTKNVGDINFASVAANGLIGGNLLGSSVTNSTIGSTLTLSANSLFFGKTPIFQMPSGTSIITGTIGNVTGGFLGGRFGADMPFGNYYGEFLGNTVGNGVSGALDEKYK